MDTRSYLLGVFDGEGSIGALQYSEGRHALSVVVGISSLDVASLFQRQWGGHCYIDSVITKGGLTLHRWMLNGRQTIAFLEDVAAHCLVKGKQAEACLPYARTFGRDPSLQAQTRLERSEIMASIHAIKSGENRYGPSSSYVDGVDAVDYTVGLFDAEGCIGTFGAGRNWVLVISIGIASEHAVRRMAEVWGGSVSKRARPSINGLVMWQWSLGGASSLNFLETVAERSLTKGRQAALARDLASNMNKYARRGGQKHGGSMVPRFITDEDLAERVRLVAEIRSLNGARSRFAKAPVES